MSIAGVLVTQLEVHSDDRGHLVQLFRRDELSQAALPEMAYLSVTEGGVVRGPHEHEKQTDIFIFCKSWFDLFLWDNREDSPTYEERQRVTSTLAGYTRVIIPPGVVHAYRATGRGTVINCPDQLFAGWRQTDPVDEIRHEEDPNSPFQLWEI